MDPVTPAAPPAPPAPAPAAPAAPASGTPGGGDPGPVPYQRFHEVNTRLQSLEAEKAQLQAQIAGHQQSVTQQLANQAAKLGTERQLHVALARAGVATDPYAEYLAAQYKALGQAAPPVDAWVESQRAATPAFFSPAAPAAPGSAPGTPAPPAPAAPGASAAAPPPAAPPAPPPAARGNPSAGTVGAPPNPPTQDPPLTLELIDQMDLATYQRRRPEIVKFIQSQRQ